MARDVRRRLPFYASDWLDAWDYRVVPATVYMYFANVLPALAFSLDLTASTDGHYGVNEVLLSSAAAAVVFSLAACQPLVIVGVTGPITVFNYTVYEILRQGAGAGPQQTAYPYLPFMAWIGLWSLLLHAALAVANACDLLRYVTRLPCDVFGFYVAAVYLQKGVQVLARLGHGAPFYLSIVAALLVFLVAYSAGELAAGTRLFGRHVRVFIKDYATPLTIVFFSAFVHWGRMAEVELEVLPTAPAFEPTVPGRSWLVEFWTMDVGGIFLALPFAVLLTILFYFDHNGNSHYQRPPTYPPPTSPPPTDPSTHQPVSSLIAQGTEFPLRKPAGFHWDLFLLGLTTGAAGILGLPFPNGLIPQAPFHTESLCVTRPASAWDARTGRRTTRLVATRVVEQRASNLLQGLLTLATMSAPLLKVLHQVPHGVLAGLFFVMAVQALEGNGVTRRIAELCSEREDEGGVDGDDDDGGGREEEARVEAGGGVGGEKGGHEGPVVGAVSGRDGEARARRRTALAEAARARRKASAVLLGAALVAFAAAFGVTQTVAAVGFPIPILLLTPVRVLLLPRWFRRLFPTGPDDDDDDGPADSSESAADALLALLDPPVASAFTMESVGGGGRDEDGADVDEAAATATAAATAMLAGAGGSAVDGRRAGGVGGEGGRRRKPENVTDAGARKTSGGGGNARLGPDDAGEDDDPTAVPTELPSEAASVRDYAVGTVGTSTSLGRRG